MSHAHMLPLHVAFIAQDRPHSPQCSLVTVVSVSQPLAAFPSQLPKPALHIPIVQTPAGQLAAAPGNAQPVPHPPQFVTVSSGVSQPLAMFPSQLPKPVLHIPNVHTPAGQVALARVNAQVVPQPLQFVVVLSAVSQPLVVLPSQFPKPVLQVSLHELAMHEATPLAPVGHTRPHTLQFPTLLVVLTSQPFVAVTSQSANPLLHVRLHEPATHALDPFAGEPQAPPHRPQCVADVLMFVSHPFAALPSQSAKPRLHGQEHKPDEHVGVVFARGSHAPPHRPQCAVDVERFASHPVLGIPSQSAKLSAHV